MHQNTKAHFKIKSYQINKLTMDLLVNVLLAIDKHKQYHIGPCTVDLV